MVVGINNMIESFQADGRVRRLLLILHPGLVEVAIAITTPANCQVKPESRTHMHDVIDVNH